MAFVHQGKILLLKRSRDVHFPGLWNFPGGMIEPGETPRAGAIREAAEEAGPLPRVVLSARCHAKRVPYTAFLAHIEAPFVPQLNWESSRYQWVSLPQARHLRLLPEVREILNSPCFAQWW